MDRSVSDFIDSAAETISTLDDAGWLSHVDGCRVLMQPQTGIGVVAGARRPIVIDQGELRDRVSTALGSLGGESARRAEQLVGSRAWHALGPISRDEVALTELPDRQTMIMRLRLGLDSSEPMTRDQIGDALG